jgi:hypothetical protein
VYAAACVVATVLIVSQTHEWDRATRVFDRALRPQWAPPAVPPGSQRFFFDNDSYYWVTFARQMVETGEWRIRHTYADNVPYGREVHWSQSVMWLLVGFGYVRHLVTGEAMVAAIEGASIWVNPFLLVFFMVGFSWLISRRMGVVAGVFFALTFVTVPDVKWMFNPFHVGHHGLHVAFSLGTVLCLVLGGLGWVKKRRPEEPPESSDRALGYFKPLQIMGKAQARRYFAAAGIFTGLGLWIGATVQFFTIGALAVGSVTLVCFMPASLTDERSEYVPELWRAWGLCASMVGLVFYLIEYFPSHMAMRLEVNHPFYILSVFCIGELMVQLTRWRARGWQGGVVGGLKLVALVGGVVLVPVLILFGPSQWHNLRDAQMARQHQFILEFYTYFHMHPEHPVTDWFGDRYGILPFFLMGALALALAGPRRTKLHEWAGLWISFFLCLFSMLLALWQVRWAGLHASMITWLMVVVAHIAWRNVLDLPAAKRRMEVWVVLGGLVLVQAAAFSVREFSEPIGIQEGRITARLWIDAAMSKHLAEGLRDESRGRPLRVLCSPDLAPVLYYFGGIPSVASLYWENVQGLHDAAAFFADRGDSMARQIAQERGLTCVLVSQDDRVAAEFNYIQTGNRSVADAQSTLLAKLFPSRRELPRWITVDQNLSRIGQRQFSLTTLQGTASLRSQMTVYHLEPTEGGERAGGNDATSTQR